ncbi:S41 family peptidase [Chlorobium phaeovibrioides]|uniref:S41 family peptidase n=1 Tax=Chlorobium phaeovibrioides TaxID=1094 RepID=UPI000F82105D|nr:S41 family peptidase [Chlorobium phaeovibrioides]RTY37433.1 S41 family peptidase [Chlorobium phaeovibrioides]
MSRIVTVLMMLAVLGFGVFLGSRLGGGGASSYREDGRLVEAYDLIKAFYVDPVAGDSLVGAGIRGMAEYLDPHSVYLAPEKAAYSQAEFDGNFDGIGIEFDVINDTLLVVTPLSGGPSAAVGIVPGDRIVAIDSSSCVGITHQDVLRKLRGRRGTTVSLRVYRPLSGKSLDFVVTRGKISTKSVDAAFMMDGGTGYIRLSRFMATTAEEFRDALGSLKKKGLKRLIVDVRGNPGGFLEQAVQVADEFLSDGELIVYTKSRNAAEDVRYMARSGDGYETGELVVVVDRGSASASEILAGALQDNQRALIVGELTFGKGLVQRQMEFNDGSALRLTVSRYYTPSGRQIQRHYSKGEDGRDRYFHESPGNIQPGKLFDDPGRLLYEKNNEFSVYRTTSLRSIPASADSSGSVEGAALKGLRSAGGIIPDYWVSGRAYTEFYQELFRTGVLEDAALKILDDPLSSVQDYRNSLASFIADYREDGRLEKIIAGLCPDKKIVFDDAAFRKDRRYIAIAVKSRIAHQLFGSEGQVKSYVSTTDPVVRLAARLPAAH